MSVKKRAIAPPIFEANDNILVYTNPLPAPTAIDIVINADEPFEEITLNVVNKNSISSEQEFWAFINSFRWADITNHQINKEIPKNGHILISDLNEISFRSFLQYFNNYKNDLLSKFSTVFVKLERQLTELEKTYLISHIIFRGKLFYNGISAEPMFAGYLVGKTEAYDEFYHNTITRKLDEKK